MMADDCSLQRKHPPLQCSHIPCGYAVVSASVVTPPHMVIVVIVCLLLVLLYLLLSILLKQACCPPLQSIYQCQQKSSTN
jgi:hypothetical protein